MVNASKVKVKAVVGPKSSDEAILSAIGGSVYEVAQISHGATLAKLSREFNYPFFSRVVPSDDYQANVFIDILEYLYVTTSRSEWLYVSVICTSDSYGVDGSKLFINFTSTADPKITVSTFQQFLPNADSVYEEVNSLKQSKVRVFLAYMVQRSFKLVLNEALQQRIVGDQFAWLCSDGCTTDSIFYDDSTRTVNKLLLNGARGLIGVVQRITSDKLQPFKERWESLDPNEYEGAGTPPSEYVYYMYDATYSIAYALHQLYESNNYDPTALNITNQIMRNVSFEGITGYVDFDIYGDRIPIFNILNLQENGKFVNVGEWTIEDQLVINSEFFFHDRSNDIDLDYQEAFEYWSCSQKASYTDKTGKTVQLDSVDGDPDDIDISYECDLYVDCNNSSDEGQQCNPSRIIGYIVIGVVAGCIFILYLTIFLPFIILFSFIIPRKRIYYSGRLFLLILVLSCMLGLTAVYPFFGKASDVACGFQVWILGLSSTFLIRYEISHYSSLCTLVLFYYVDVMIMCMIMMMYMMCMMMMMYMIIMVMIMMHFA
jgi:ABC-type branched-subunit amino acid transport system substrate-binding protein